MTEEEENYNMIFKIVLVGHYKHINLRLFHKDTTCTCRVQLLNE